MRTNVELAKWRDKRGFGINESAVGALPPTSVPRVSGRLSNLALRSGVPKANSAI